MPTVKDVLDPRYARREAKGYDLSVSLKKGRKGTSLYARKLIKKGRVVAYYKFLVHRYDGKFKGKKGDMYAMSVYTKKGNISNAKIGDIYSGSLPPPKNNVPYWAYFSNEPSGRQEENCYLDINLTANYKDRKVVKVGDSMVYKLIASRDILPGEEICWCYGEEYGRNYKANCD